MKPTVSKLKPTTGKAKTGNEFETIFTQCIQEILDGSTDVEVPDQYALTTSRINGKLTFLWHDYILMDDDSDMAIKQSFQIAMSESSSISI